MRVCVLASGVRECQSQSINAYRRRGVAQLCVHLRPDLVHKLRRNRQGNVVPCLRFVLLDIFSDLVSGIRISWWWVDRDQNSVTPQGYLGQWWQRRIKTMRCIRRHLGEIGVTRKEFRANRTRKIDEGFVNRSLFCPKPSEARQIGRGEGHTYLAVW